MGKKIKVFLDSASTFRERDILKKFYNGIIDELYEKEFDISSSYTACDVAVIFGSWKPKERDHHVIRNAVAAEANTFIVIETPLLGRKVHSDNDQFRIGVNGFLNNHGIFTNLSDHPITRLKTLDIAWDGWRNSSTGHILLMLQLPGDASLRGIDIYEWALETIVKLRETTDREIRIRIHPHHRPKDSDPIHKLISDIFRLKILNVSISDGKEINLDNDLKDAYCSVSYTSGSSIDSIIAGIPCISVDPGNFSYDVSSNFISEINSLKLVDETTINDWLKKLSFSQWSIEEMENGTAFRHLLPLLIELENKNRFEKKRK